MYTYIYFILFLLTLQRNDEEAVVDRGGTRSILKTHFEKEDLEGELLFLWGSCYTFHRHYKEKCKIFSCEKWKMLIWK